MDIRTVIFYVALLLIAGTLVELYVRVNGIGENVEKVRGVPVPRKPKLGRLFVFLLAAIITAAVTIPH